MPSTTFDDTLAGALLMPELCWILWQAVFQLVPLPEITEHLRPQALVEKQPLGPAHTIRATLKKYSWLLGGLDWSDVVLGEAPGNKSGHCGLQLY